MAGWHCMCWSETIRRSDAPALTASVSVGKHASLCAGQPDSVPTPIALAMRALGRCPAVSQVKLDDCRANLAHMLGSCKNLKQLKLGNTVAASFGPHALHALAKCTRLEALTLRAPHADTALGPEGNDAAAEADGSEGIVLPGQVVALLLGCTALTDLVFDGVIRRFYPPLPATRLRLKRLTIARTQILPARQAQNINQNGATSGCEMCSAVRSQPILTPFVYGCQNTSRIQILS